MITICPYCGGRYDVGPGSVISEFRTADLAPHYAVEVRVDGVVAHECSKGIERSD